MRRASFSAMNCSIAQTLEIVGEWWTLLILRDAFLGVRRFDEFQQRLGIARNVLAARLDHLVEAGVMERRVYDEGRNRADYVLTERGRALWPVLTALRQWGDDWLLDGHEPVQLEHRGCEGSIRAELHCSTCGDPLELRELRMVPGPGAVGDELPTPS